MGMSKHLKKSVLEFTFAGQAFTSPSANLFLALHTADPTEEGNVGEVDVLVDDTAYVRTAVTFAVTTVGSENEVKNDAAVIFPPTVYGTGAAEYVITYIAVYDAVTAGNLIEVLTLTAPITRAETVGLTFDPSTLIISLDN